MKKSDRIESFLHDLGPSATVELDRCYVGFFTCFNRGDYYEAHDVLEHLWLKCRDESYPFYKGLIQIAGAFVHLRKQYLRPLHPTDGARLRPAVRLFQLGCGNLKPFRPVHLGLDVEAVLVMCNAIREAVEESGYTHNPWQPDQRPAIALL